MENICPKCGEKMAAWWGFGTAMVPEWTRWGCENHKKNVLVQVTDHALHKLERWRAFWAAGDRCAFGPNPPPKEQ